MDDQFTISVNTLYAVLFAIAAVTAGALFAAMRNRLSLAWLLGSVSIGAVQVYNVGTPRSELWDQASAAALVMASFLCFAEAIRESYRQAGGEGRWRSAAIGLLVASVGATLLGLPHILAFWALVAAFAMVELEMVRRLARVRERSIVDWLLLIAMTGVFLVESSRLVTTPLALGLSVSFEELRHSVFDRRYLTILGALELSAVVLLFTRIVGRAIDNMRRRAERDYLTGLYNRGMFDHRAGELIRSGDGVFILADLDHFKQVNDRYGHVMGDGAICVFADLLDRHRGLAGRVGGEEFALVLPGADKQEALAEAETLRAAYAHACTANLAIEEPFTVSIGCTPFVAGEESADVRQRADTALYRAKRAGRDRVECETR